MILSPGEQRSLRVISGSIAEGEPHLAGMFRIFTRLHKDDAAPPVEDLIVAIPRAGSDGAGTEQPGGRSRLRRWLRLPRGTASLPLPAPSPEAERLPGAGHQQAGWRPTADQLPGMMRARPLSGEPRARRPRRDWMRRRGTLRAGQVLAAFAVPVVLLATLLMVILFGLNSSIRCQSGRTATTSGSTSASGAAGGGGRAGATGTAGSTGTTARTGGGAAVRTATGAAGAAASAGSSGRAGAGSAAGTRAAGSGRPAAAGPAPDRLTRPGGSIGLLPTGCLRSGTSKTSGH